jgi:fumarate reductase flavoprotein subunit
MSKIRNEMGQSMEEGVGIYREEESMQKTVDVLKSLQKRIVNVGLTDRGRVFNTEWMNLIELGYTLDVAQCMVHSAINRKESRGSHQRLDGPNGAYKQRDDVNFLKHSLAFKTEGDEPRIEYSDVKITTFQPAKRVYGAEAEAAEAARKKAQEAK